MTSTPLIFVALCTLAFLDLVKSIPCNADDVAFTQEVNAYRISKGKRAQAITAALVHVAGIHSSEYYSAGSCNAHSWLGGTNSGVTWPACCYNPSDLSSTQDCMTGKPELLTTGATGYTVPYTGNGYEISGSYGRDSICAAWEASYGHKIYLLNGNGNVENAIGCSARNTRRNCWMSSQPGTDDRGGICDGTSRYNSLCEASDKCDGTGYCDWCGGGDWKCCGAGATGTGCLPSENADRTAPICMRAVDPMGADIDPHWQVGTPWWEVVGEPAPAEGLSTGAALAITFIVLLVVFMLTWCHYPFLVSAMYEHPPKALLYAEPEEEEEVEDTQTDAGTDRCSAVNKFFSSCIHSDSANTGTGTDESATAVPPASVKATNTKIAKKKKENDPRAAADSKGKHHKVSTSESSEVDVEGGHQGM